MNFKITNQDRKIVQLACEISSNRKIAICAGCSDSAVHAFLSGRSKRITDTTYKIIACSRQELQILSGKIQSALAGAEDYEK